MEFHEKLQTLRRQKGLTQEELAAELFVSRTAVSKWESGRGYPSIDSLKAISRFYGVTIDALLSGDEVLTIAREEQRERDARHRDRIFGLLDCGSAMLLFLPLFGQEADGIIRAVALPGLTGVSAYLKIAYFALVLAAVGLGCFSLAVQGRGRPGISMGLSIAGVFLFLASRQPLLALPTGFCLLEKRFVDVAIRYGTHPATIDRWKAVLEIKSYFEEIIGCSIYDLLPGVIENSFK